MKTALATIFAGLLASTPLAAQAAEDFPAKAMTYIIPFNAGGESDISARFQQSEWENVTGHQVSSSTSPAQAAHRPGRN